MKICRICSQEKVEDEFAFRRVRTQLRMTICRVCYRTLRRSNRPPLPNKPILTLRVCVRCQIEKRIQEFPPNRKTCRACKYNIELFRIKGLKQCPKCLSAKDPSEFYFKGTTLKQRRSICILCTQKYERLPDSRERNRINSRKSQTGFTPQLWQLAIQLQESRCAICRISLDPKSKQTHADHCHRTKKPRGVLCSKCNTALGLLNDDIDVITRAAAYLARPTLREVSL